MAERLPISGCLLAGGQSLRMGRDKALVDFEGKPLIARLAERLSAVCDEVLVSARSPDAYAFFELPMIEDCFPGRGPLSGIHAALQACSRPWLFALACDMPFFSEALLREQWRLGATGRWEVICPESEGGLEPLHGLYHKRILPEVEKALAGEDFQVSSFFPRVRTRTLSWEEVREVDPEGFCFRNWNRPEDVEPTGKAKS